MTNGRLVQALTRTLTTLLAMTPDHGADTLIWPATSPEAGKHNSEYL